MLRRRQLLRTTVATAGVLLVGAGCGDDGSRSVEDGEAFFPQSVASGDPRPDSVILWTRVEDPDVADGPIDLELEVARDQAFSDLVELDGGSSLVVRARVKFHRCVRVRVEGLEPATTYFYRFIRAVDGVSYGTRIGRTRTAPAPDSDEPVRFAYMSCQDFGGRYYNVHARMAELDLDFIVHLGDYIYETAGDPGFQQGDANREIVFDDTEGAIQVGDADNPFYAARSLDNYRQLYRTYRGDAALQRLHERFPMIVVWDDHEFADDCHGATATHTDGREDETDVERRRNANQAWFEFMPVDYAGEPAFEYDDAVDPPGDIRIYRDLKFGKHVHLVITDLRSHRPDHLIPEDAYPGGVVLTQADLMDLTGGVPADAVPYVDVDSFDGGRYRDVLATVADDGGYDGSRIGGLVSVEYINEVVDAADQIAEDAQMGLERGYAFQHMLKVTFYGSIGSRYLVIQPVFDLWAQKRFVDSNGDSEHAMGATQEAWFLETMASSSATWKVWANEYCLSRLSIDLRQTLSIPASFQKRFHVTVEDWGGFPNKRDELIDRLSAVGNVVAITGDIHAFFANTPMVPGDPDKRIVELVGSSASSQTWKSILVGRVQNDPVLKDVDGATILAELIGELLTVSGGPNPHIAHVEPSVHGFAVVDADADHLRCTFHEMAEHEVDNQRYDDADLAQRFETVEFRVAAGSPDLYKKVGGGWKRWDPGGYKFV